VPKAIGPRRKPIIAVEIARGSVTRGLNDAAGDLRVARGKVGHDAVEKCALDPKADHAAAESKACDLAVDDDRGAYKSLIAETVADLHAINGSGVARHEARQIRRAEFASRRIELRRAGEQLLDTLELGAVAQPVDITLNGQRLDERTFIV
jgi:hypothetical protein